MHMYIIVGGKDSLESWYIVYLVAFYEKTVLIGNVRDF